MKFFYGRNISYLIASLVIKFLEVLLTCYSLLEPPLIYKCLSVYQFKIMHHKGFLSCQLYCAYFIRIQYQFHIQYELLTDIVCFFFQQRSSQTQQLKAEVLSRCERIFSQWQQILIPTFKGLQYVPSRLLYVKIVLM